MANGKAPPINWIPADDLLLTKSIERGASIEALAKGAVKFSRRFTLQELQERWHSLLYDNDVSEEASRRMYELERAGSTPTPRSSRFCNAKGSEKVGEKRKGESIRSHYYALRKRIRSECYGSTDLGFLDQPNVPNHNEHGHDFQAHAPLNNEDHCGDSMIGDCLANNLGLQETDLEILRLAFPETIGVISATTGTDNAGNGLHNGFHNTFDDNNLNSVVRKDGQFGFPAEMKIEPEDGTHTLEGGFDGFGKCLGLPGTGPSQTHDVKLLETNKSQGKQVSNYDIVNGNKYVPCSGFGGKQYFNSPGSDGSASFHMMEFSSPPPRLPLWKTMEDVSAPDMPVDENNGEVPQAGVQIPGGSDCRNETTAGYDATCSASLLIERPDASEFINPHVVSVGEFTDLSDSLLIFPNEDELLYMDVDGKDTMDYSCHTNLNSLLLGSREEIVDGNICEVEDNKVSVSNSTIAAPVFPCPSESEDVAPVHDEQLSCRQVMVDVPPSSVLNFVPLQISEGEMNCVLNTEDPEIPCNDDIFLLIHPGTAFGSSARQPIRSDSMDSSADEKDGEQGLNMMNTRKDPESNFSRSQMVGPTVLPESVSGRPPVGCAAKSELPETKSVVLRPALPSKSIRDPHQSRSGHISPMTTVAGVLEEDHTKVEPRAADTPAIYSERPLHQPGSVELNIPESIANPSTSDQDECESDGDIPYYSDIEAMILDMDLASDQDSYFSRRAARYPSEETKRIIIRLEQTAKSSMQRTMTYKGAFAIFFGRHLKHYIQKTEVTIGRSTADNDIDIDLRREARANMISRRQATIKMEADGSFILKNIGKNTIHVNDQAVTSGKELTLSSSCLIEIKGMSFVFEINEKYVRRYLDDLMKQQQGNIITYYESSPDEEE